jgi:hypothetical protein
MKDNMNYLGSMSQKQPCWDTFEGRQEVYQRISHPLDHLDPEQLCSLLVLFQIDILRRENFILQVKQKRQSLPRTAHREEERGELESPFSLSESVSEVEFLQGDEDLTREELLEAVRRRKERVEILDSKELRYRYVLAVMELESRLTEIEVSAIQPWVYTLRRKSPDYNIKEEPSSPAPSEGRLAPTRFEIQCMQTKLHDIEASADHEQRRIHPRYRSLHLRLRQIAKRVLESQRKLRELERLVPDIWPLVIPRHRGPTAKAKAQALAQDKCGSTRKIKIEDLCNESKLFIEQDPSLREVFEKDSQEALPRRIKVEDLLNDNNEDEMDYTWERVLISTEEMDALQQWETQSPKIKTEEYSNGVQETQDENEHGPVSGVRLGATHRQSVIPKIKTEEPANEALAIQVANQQTTLSNAELGTVSSQETPLTNIETVDPNENERDRLKTIRKLQLQGSRLARWI